MKWFFKWLRNGINTIDTEDRDNERRAIDSISPKMTVGLKYRKAAAMTAGNIVGGNDGNVHLSQSPMNFRIYPATGGHIVEYSYYNEQTDKNDQALHLIPSELDLGTELAKIMTLEALKR